MNERFNMIRRLPARLFTPVDNASLVFFRIAFGFLMLVEVWRYLDHDWVSSYYIEPQFLFTYMGFEWVKPWPGQGMFVLFYVLGLAAVGIMCGFLYRFCAVVFFLGFSQVFFLAQSRYLNHFYLIMLVAFLMVWISPHRAFSVDARLRPKTASDVAPTWMLWIMRAQLGCVYFFGGVAKISRDWLAGKPLDSWLADDKDIPIVGWFIEQDWGPLFFSWSGLWIDLAAVPLLLYRRTRMPMFLILTLFHLTNARLFGIGIFPWMAIGMTTLFLDPGWPRRIFNWPGKASEGPLSPPERLAFRQKLIVGFLTAFMTFQIAMPLRHHFFPGDVAWTEEGHNYSWRMKLRSKTGRARFILTDTDTGRVWVVKPSKYLNRRQRRKMAARPQMILQFAHFLAEQARKEGHQNVEVRAEVQVSLNGRRARAIIDETVDLAAQKPRPFSSDPWILKWSPNK
ncbi:MAG: HTTM domain-containing protein [Acidobacteriota bacterium]|nr:HTTM domain-containing protein [Acidobacteriota bacterium]